jgi:formamidopyrimidine-DNA glycosylase
MPGNLGVVPELVEVEAYRALAERALDRPIVRVDAPDAWYLKRGLTPTAARRSLTGRRLTAARRIGKLLLLDTDGGPVLGLHFGMSGRLIVDGTPGVDRLMYSSDRELDGWDRFALRFADRGDLRMRDPRRLGAVELDPDESRLGRDALALTPAELRAALAGSRAAVKTRLLDQARIAGIGNLIADEALWRAGLAPTRPGESLAPAELRRLHRHLRQTIADFIQRGGSHTGELMPARTPGGLCPRDGAPLRRETVGTRTTYWCPRHQR